MNQAHYDVALSFAGEDRRYADELAAALKKRNINVFYDAYEQTNLWGKNLYEHLSDIYQNQAHYCVIFISKHYNNKLWTNHERKSAQARSFRENEEYILPIRLDNTEIAGILPTAAYLKWPPENANSIANAISEKLYKDNQSISSVTKKPSNIPTNVEVIKDRHLDRKSTEVSFSLQYRHTISVEWFIGLLQVTFVLLLDNREIYRRDFGAYQLLSIEKLFQIENVECSVKYKWAFGAYLGHIYVGGKALA